MIRYRVLRIVFGYIWAAGLLLIGTWLWRVPALHAVEGNSESARFYVTRTLALAGWAGGLFVFMWLVADVMFPKAPLLATALARVLAAVAFWACIVFLCSHYHVQIAAWGSWGAAG